MLDRDDVLQLRSVCREVLVAPHVQDYAVQLVMATQPDEKEAHELARKYIRYGSSPRGAQALVECGRVLALLRGRFHLSVDDIKELAPVRPAPPHHSELRRTCRRQDARFHPGRHHLRRNRPRLRRIGLSRDWLCLSPNEPLLDREFLERLERLTIHWQRSFAGLVGGHNRSRFAGGGQEFLDHRHFHQGDDLRAVNWRAYMRLDKMFLKMFQIEPRVPVRLLLDTSASMAAGTR